MNKPLLLLVDDDRAVLDALEAELMPEFADLCRIESFTDPHTLIDSLPRWAAERRAIAVAIVDQKMPVMTGVGLLTELRQISRHSAAAAFAPGRHFRALMLTGYAGLDSAMAAKNEGGVERYLEKPWRGKELRSCVQIALANWAQESVAGSHYIFRELKDPDEVREALALRYDVYSRQARLSGVLPDVTEERLDVDAFDRYARLYGVFEHRADGARLVGTIRVVGDIRTDSAPVLEALLDAASGLGGRLRSERGESLPMLKYLIDREAVVRLISRIHASGEEIVEPGRLALHPNYREGGDSGARHVARHIIESSVAFFLFHYKVANAILACAPPHDAFYKPYGFTVAAGTEVRHTPLLGGLVACLHGRFDQVPAAAGTRCDELAQRIGRVGKTCRCPSFPACLGGPYGTGDFVPVDVFCPELASRRAARAPESRV